MNWWHLRHCIAWSPAVLGGRRRLVLPVCRALVDGRRRCWRRSSAAKSPAVRSISSYSLVRLILREPNGTSSASAIANACEKRGVVWGMPCRNGGRGFSRSGCIHEAPRAESRAWKGTSTLGSTNRTDGIGRAEHDVISSDGVDALSGWRQVPRPTDYYWSSRGNSRRRLTDGGGEEGHESTRTQPILTSLFGAVKGSGQVVRGCHKSSPGCAFIVERDQSRSLLDRTCSMVHCTIANRQAVERNPDDRCHVAGYGRDGSIAGSLVVQCNDPVGRQPDFAGLWGRHADRHAGAPLGLSEAGCDLPEPPSRGSCGGGAGVASYGGERGQDHATDDLRPCRPDLG